LKSRLVFAKRIAENHIFNECLKCDCILSRDLISTQFECQLCAQRSQTIDQTIDDSIIESEQQIDEELIE
jgi:hypothetical protein